MKRNIFNQKFSPEANSELRQPVFLSDKIEHAASGAPFKLFGERRNIARRLVARQAFDAPHREKNIRRADKRLAKRDGARPVFKRTEVDAAQEDASRADFIEHAPALFAWAVQHDQDQRARPDVQTRRVSSPHASLLHFPCTHRRNRLADRAHSIPPPAQLRQKFCDSHDNFIAPSRLCEKFNSREVTDGANGIAQPPLSETAEI